jgi:hypothetical protein
MGIDLGAEGLMAGRRAVDTVNGRRNDGARMYRSIGIAMFVCIDLVDR